MSHELIREKLDDVRRRLALLPYASDADFEGCTYGEIAELEQYAGRPLPFAYRYFLHLMGRRSTFLVGSDYLLTDEYNLRMREVATEIVQAKGRTLAVGAFPFLIHQGCLFLYFQLGRSEDPPVFCSYPDSRCVADSFSAFALGTVRDLEVLAARDPEAFAPLEDVPD